ncbi:MAG: hypothetical protein ACKVZ0_06080 [Gemmatimonadales bacterium]
MPRTLRRLTAVLLLFSSACAVDKGGEDTTTSIPPAGPRLGPPAVPNPLCSPVTSDEIRDQLRVLYREAGWSDVNTALARFETIEGQVGSGEIDEARIGTRDLVRLIEAKFGQLTPEQQAASQAELDELRTDLFCYVGISGQVFDLNPGDPTKAFEIPAVVGVQFPPNSVPVGTLVSVTDIATGPAPLVTNLDTYPGYVAITLYPNTVLAADAVVVICAPPQAPATLLVGHQDPTVGFELLTPTPVPSLLQSTCSSPLPTSQNRSGWLGRLMAQMTTVLTPQPLQAAPMMFLGGVGGLTRKFSPFGLVDPSLNAVGGVGGSTRKFTPPAGAPSSGPAANPPFPPLFYQGPVGTSTTTGLPFATVATPGGDPDGSNLIAGVTVTFRADPATTFDPDANAKVCRVIGGVVTIQDTVQVQTDVNGIATLPCLSFGTVAGFANLEATFDPTSLQFPNSGLVSITAVDGTTTGTSLNWLIKADAGQPTALSIVTAPSSSAQAGVPLTTQPAFQLQDTFGNPVTASGTDVTATVTSGGGTASFTGPVTTDPNGIAQFTDLAIGGPVAGTPQTVTFSFGGAATPVAVTIQLAAGPPSALVVVSSPSSSAQAGVVWTNQPALSITDQYGNQVDTGLTVDASVASGAPTLAGTTSVAAVAGVATFTDLRIDGLVGNRTIRFGSGALTAAVSGPISVGAGPAAQIAITTEPSSTAQAGIAFPTQPIVAIQDRFGNLVASSANVTAAIAAGAGTLGGTTVVAAVGGVAAYTDLRIDGGVGDRTLRFTSGSFVSPQSTPITIGAGAATRIQTYLNGIISPTFSYPAELPRNVAVAPSPQVLVTDAWSNPVPNQPVYWNAATGNGGSLTVGATGSPTGANGLAQVAAWMLGDGLNVATAGLFAPGVTPTLPGYLDAQFSALTGIGQAVFACAAVTAKTKTDVAPFSIKTPTGTVRAVTLYLSVNGQSSALSSYPATLEVFKGSYGLAANKIGSGAGVVQLPGNNGNAAPITITLSDPATQAESQGSAVLWFQLTITAPSNRKPQAWYTSATFKTTNTCYHSVIYTPTYPTSTSFKRGLAIQVTN